VLQAAAATADQRARAVQRRDQKDESRARILLQTRFPSMPASSREAVLKHAFLEKGSGRVGRSTTRTDERKAVLAVEAHIRHVHTPYEALLDSDIDREEARLRVWPAVQEIKTQWSRTTDPTGESSPQLEVQKTNNATGARRRPPRGKTKAPVREPTESPGTRDE
jgi:hypothetical protein